MNIIVIGGGPAGLMAAIQAAAKNPDAKIRILEQNEKIAKKLLATGNGKCNFSNMDSGLHNYLTMCPGQLDGIFKQFSFSDTRKFFTSAGIVIKDRNGWLYPMSEQAQSVAAILERMARKAGVTIKTREHVSAIEKNEAGFLVKTDTWSYQADRVILTAGGQASSIEGSSEEGMNLALSSGHKIIKPLPALVPLRLREKEYFSWAGTRMDGKVTLYIDGRQTGTETGELQFADYGISGIAIFQLSLRAVRACDEKKKVELEIDLMPSFTDHELQRILENRRKTLSVKTEAELFTGFLPDRMIRSLIRKNKLPDEAYVKKIKHLRMTVTGAHSYERAQVVSGGIDLKEIHPVTMESLKIPGLYFAGEIVDVCGPCGGYNLQWAWTSGAVAGMHAAVEEKI